MAKKNQKTQPKPKREASLAAPTGSDLCESLDDGQEIKLYKLMGSGRGYYAQIHGDMFLESMHPESLDAAIKDVAAKYKKWKAETE